MNKNIKVVMLTGDNEKTAKVMADEIGIDEVIANVQKTNPLGYDYNVTIYENNLCSDKAILMLAASYVSDYVADQQN